MVGVVLDVTLTCVDALCQRIDADFLAAIGDLSIASERTAPVLAVGFDVFGKVGVVSEPGVEEVSVPTATYLFFKSGDDVYMRSLDGMGFR